MVSLAIWMAFFIFFRQTESSVPLVSPQKRLISNSLSSCSLLTRRFQRNWVTLVIISVRCFSVYPNSLIRYSSFLPLQQYFVPILSSSASIKHILTSSEDYRSFLKPNILSCFSKDSRLRLAFSLRACSNVSMLKIVSTWFRASYSLMVSSHNELSKAMNYKVGRFLERWRGGGGILEKLWKLIYFVESSKYIKSQLLLKLQNNSLHLYTQSNFKKALPRQSQMCTLQRFPQFFYIHTLSLLFFRLNLQTFLLAKMEDSQFPQFHTLIEEAIVVGLGENCKCLQNSTEFKWITSLQIISQAQYDLELLNLQEHRQLKYLDIGNELYLKVCFCEKEKKPITKIKSSKRISSPDIFPVPYPYQLPEEEYLCFMVKQNGKIIIEDLEMVQVKLDSEIEMPDQNNYEIIRLPSPCQQVEKEEHSNSEEQMLIKIRYLLVKTLDLQEQEHNLVQHFEPQVIFQHSMKNKSTLIHYNSFHEFCFPQGVILSKRIMGYGYSIFNFILTQQNGTRIYVNCLKFKQKLEDEIAESLPSNCIDKHIHNHEVLYTEKAFCLLSRYCLTEFFHNLLEELFRKFQSHQNVYSLRIHPHQLDEETRFLRVIHGFIDKYQIGYKESQKQFHQSEYLREDIHLEMEWDHRNIIFPLPKDENYNSYSPKAIHCLFKMLSVDKIVEVIEALLLEKTVIFVSQSQVAVGYVIESLISFLYPLKWEHVILPILPYDLLNLLEAPMPLIAGIPTNFASDDVIHQLKDDSVIVFLDCNDLIHKNPDREVFNVNHMKEAVKNLRHYDIYHKAHVNQMLEYRDQFYLFKIYQKEQSHFCAEHIKHIFFETILLLLQNYHMFYNKNQNNQKYSISSGKPRKRGFNFKKDYNLEQFIKSHPKKNLNFMKKFTESSLFGHFIYQYSENSYNPTKEVIDSAIRKQSIAQTDFALFQNRYSEQPYSTQEICYLRKKLSWPNNVHNLTWSPQPKKVEGLSETNYSRTFDKNIFKSQEIELEIEKQINEEQKRRQQISTGSPGSNICEALAKAMRHVSNTKRNLLMWTAARVSRLKKEFYDHKEKEPEKQVQRQNQKGEKEKEEKKVDVPVNEKRQQVEVLPDFN